MNRFPAAPVVRGAALCVCSRHSHWSRAWRLSSPGCSPQARLAPPGELLRRRPGFGPHVYVFSPDMPLRHIESVVNSIARQQAGNQFGSQRYALLFKPGTYGSAAKPLYLQIGYYPSIAGLGGSPADVVINGTVDSFNQCFAPGFPRHQQLHCAR